MAKRGDGVRVLSAFFAGVLLAGTCARVASGPVPTPRASVDATPLVWATRVDLATEEARGVGVELGADRLDEGAGAVGARQARRAPR